MVRSSVGIMPMSPEHAVKVGFYSIFAYAHRLAQLKNLDTVYGVNIVGRAGAQDTKEVLEESIELLDISPTYWWVDTAVESFRVESEIRYLIANGYIQESQRNVLRCSCGKVEYLDGVLLRGSSKTLLDNGYAKCCHSRVCMNLEQVLLSAPLPASIIPNVSPLWARKELMEILRVLEGSQILISRGTRRRFNVSLQSRSWDIDNDILWWLYTQFLKDDGFHIQHLVAGVSIVRQVALLFAWMTLLGIPLPESVHFVPKVLFEPVNEITTLSQAISQFGQKKVASTLTWRALSKRKQVTLQGSLFSHAGLHVSEGDLL